MSNKKIIFIKEAERRTGKNRITLWRWWQENKFPKPFKVESQNAWLESTIDQWIDEKAGIA